MTLHEGVLGGDLAPAARRWGAMVHKPDRRKAAFERNAGDGAKVHASMQSDGKIIVCHDLPLSNHASSSYDRVEMGGKVVGQSMFAGDSYIERTMPSPGTVDAGIFKGDILTLVWGEENGGTEKTTVERRYPSEIRVRVAPTPYSRDSRESWRTGKSQGVSMLHILAQHGKGLDGMNCGAKYWAKTSNTINLGG